MNRKTITGKKPFYQGQSNQPESMPELTYVTDDELLPVSEAKWKIPKPGIEADILKAARHKKYTSHAEKKAVQDIAKGALTLQKGVIGRYPTEWIDNCIEFCNKLWAEHNPMPLHNLIKYINNEEKKDDWCIGWGKRNGIGLTKPMQKE